jgi:NAD+ synthase (glutamine-hydrolysing)
VKLALAQVNTHVGAIDRNTRRLIEAAERARDEHDCALIIFPELAVCGYPPEDLLLHVGLRKRVGNAIESLVGSSAGIALCFGYPEYVGQTIYNSACIARDRQKVANYRKWVLPNYAVFDEKRYFEPGDTATVFDADGIRCGLIICEDAWSTPASAAAAAAGAELIVVINGSPFHRRQRESRERIIANRARETGLPIVYLNMVGGQDELVFDGGSFVVDAAGEVIMRLPQFVEAMACLEVRRDDDGLELLPAETIELEGTAADAVSELPPVMDPLEHVEEIYEALVLGTRDYIEKNAFPGVILGLSGGIDSALTLCIAVDAIGPERVRAVMMPSQFTSQMSLDDAAEQAAMLGVRHDVLPIGPIVDTIIGTLAPIFEGRPRDSTEENIQARGRGILLMAISNKLGSMLLTTGNKSEMAVGYATLYGDMAGGFAPLKDCSKTLVYQLAELRNTREAAIPQRVIEREPSAELAPDQRDSDSLPPYERLDAILEAFIERDESVDEITAAGFDRDEVVRVLNMVKRAEYKRRQAPPGVRISGRAFGRDWRYPITSGY